MLLCGPSFLTKINGGLERCCKISSMCGSHPCSAASTAALLFLGFFFTVFPPFHDIISSSSPAETETVCDRLEIILNLSSNFPILKNCVADSCASDCDLKQPVVPLLN